MNKNFNAQKNELLSFDFDSAYAQISKAKDGGSVSLAGMLVVKKKAG